MQLTAKSVYLEALRVSQELKDQYVAIRSAFGDLRLTRTELLALFIRKNAHDAALYWQDARVRGRTVIIGIVIMAAMLSLDAIFRPFASVRRRGIPVLKPSKGVSRSDFRAMVEDGHAKYPGTPYIITYSGYENVVYPSSCFDEVKRLPSTQASLVSYITHVFCQGWRFIGTDDSALHKTIATDLARAVPKSIRARQDHTRQAFDAVVGPCEDWKPLKLFWTLSKLVVRINAASFMGPELTNNARWLQAVQLFPAALIMAVFACHGTPRVFRPAISLLVFIPAWLIYWYMQVLLRPTVERDIRDFEAASADGEVPGLLQRTLATKFPITAWLMGRHPPEHRIAAQIIRDYINLAFESTSSTAATIYFLLSELVCRPELVEELREELSQVMVDGELPLTQLGELRKLDSVMRESSRVNVFSHLGLYRRTLEPVKLSVGPELPRGSLICVDAHHINTSPELWPEPATFDPMRFYKLRQEPGQELRYQFTSLGSDSPGWGDGPQACPGRMFAATTIKIVIAQLLLDYDIKLVAGAGKPKRYAMPNDSFAPDMWAQILVRKRKAELGSE